MGCLSTFILALSLSSALCCQPKVHRVHVPPRRPPPRPPPPPLTFKNCPPSKTVYTSLGKFAAMVPPNPPVFDSFDQLVKQSGGPKLGDFLPPGRHKISYRTQDKHGRVAICVQNIIVEVARCSNLPRVPPNGSITCDPKVQDLAGTHCFYSCDEFFQISGQYQTRCLSNGTWSASEMPKCQTRCQDPIMRGKNGTVVCSGFPIRICLVVCDKGYELPDYLLRAGGYIYCSSEVGEWSPAIMEGCVKSLYSLDSISDTYGDPQVQLNQTMQSLNLSMSM